MFTLPVPILTDLGLTTQYIVIMLVLGIMLVINNYSGLSKGFDKQSKVINILLIVLLILLILLGILGSSYFIF